LTFIIRCEIKILALAVLVFSGRLSTTLQCETEAILASAERLVVTAIPSTLNKPGTLCATMTLPNLEILTNVANLWRVGLADLDVCASFRRVGLADLDVLAGSRRVGLADLDVLACFHLVFILLLFLILLLLGFIVILTTDAA
jgi:hypothetical protein